MGMDFPFTDRSECWQARLPMEILCDEIQVVSNQEDAQDVRSKDRLTSIATKTFRVLGDYNHDQKEHSLNARMHLLNKLKERLEFAVLRHGNSEPLKQVKNAVENEFNQVREALRNSWLPVENIGHAYTLEEASQSYNTISEAAILLNLPGLWKDPHFGLHLATALKIFTEDLLDFKESLADLKGATDPHVILLDSCSKSLAKSSVLAQQLLDLKLFYLDHLTVYPIQNPTTDPNLAQFYDLSTLYAIEQGRDKSLPNQKLLEDVEGKIKDIVFTIQQQIYELRKGESVLIPGGYTSSDSWQRDTTHHSHSNLYHLARVDSELEDIPRYNLTVIDDGSLTEHRQDHDYLGIDRSDVPQGYCYDQMLSNLSMGQVVDEKMWTELMRTKVVSNLEVRTRFHSMLVWLHATGRSEFERGPVHKIYPDIGGCSYRSPLFWLKRTLPPDLFGTLESIVKTRTIDQLKEFKVQYENPASTVRNELDSFEGTIRGESLKGIKLLDFLIHQLELIQYQDSDSEAGIESELT